MLSHTAGFPSFLWLNTIPLSIYIYIHCIQILFFIIYLFMAALGLRCFVWALSSCGEQGLLFITVNGFLIAVASLVAEHGR